MCVCCASLVIYLAVEAQSLDRILALVTTDFDVHRGKPGQRKNICAQEVQRQPKQR